MIRYYLLILNIVCVTQFVTTSITLFEAVMCVRYHGYNEIIIENLTNDKWR